MNVYHSEWAVQESTDDGDTWTTMPHTVTADKTEARRSEDKLYFAKYDKLDEIAKTEKRLIEVLGTAHMDTEAIKQIEHLQYRTVRREVTEWEET